MAINPTVLVGTKDERTVASTTSTPGYPSGLAANDLLIVFGVSGATVNNVFSNPTGFTSRGQLSNTGNTAAPSAYVGTKFATGSETGTLSCPHTNVITSMGLIAVRGVDTTTPMDISVVTADKTTASSSFTFSSVTPVTNGCMAVYLSTPASTTITGTPPTGYTEDYDRTTASSRSWNVGHKAGLTTSATGSIVGTWLTSAKDVGILLILRPAVPPVSTNGRLLVSGVWTPARVRLPDGAGGWT